MSRINHWKHILESSFAMDILYLFINLERELIRSAAMKPNMGTILFGLCGHGSRLKFFRGNLYEWR